MIRLRLDQFEIITVLDLSSNNVLVQDQVSEFMGNTEAMPKHGMDV